MLTPRDSSPVSARFCSIRARIAPHRFNRSVALLIAPSSCHFRRRAGWKFQSLRLVRLYLLAGSGSPGGGLGILAAEADKEHSQQDQTQTGELLFSKRLVKEDLGPYQAPDVSQRDHWIENRKLATLDAGHIDGARTQEQRHAENQPGVQKAPDGFGQPVGAHLEEGHPERADHA